MAMSGIGFAGDSSYAVGDAGGAYGDQHAGHHGMTSTQRRVRMSGKRHKQTKKSHGAFGAEDMSVDPGLRRSVGRY